VRISKRAALQKHTRPEKATSKEIDPRLFLGVGSFKNTITSRKVSIYCGITFLSSFF
jgi:hypothetical protein